MPQNTSRTSTPGRGARSRYARRRPAEAGRRRAHIDSWTGARSPRYVRSATAAKPRRRSRTTTHGRVPGHGTLGRSWPKPETTSRTSTFGRVPDRRRTLCPLQPKPERTSHAPTAGRVSPFPLIQLTINRRTARDQVVPCSSNVRASTAEAASACSLITAQHPTINTSSARNRSGESASHTAQ